MEEKVEEKPKVEPQAPAEAKPKVEEKKDEKKVEGLEALVADPKKLRELYNKTPQMFKDAGLIEEKKEEKQPDPKPDDKKPTSAAPKAPVAKYADKEIKLPEDVPVNAEAVQPYFDHWKEQGWSPEQVQKEVDFMGKRAREEKKAREEQEKKQKTPAEIAKEEDDRNVKTLQSDPEFGKDYQKNMEVSRRAAIKYGNKDALARLATSDPVWVKHFWDLGKLDVEDRTPSRGSPRNGEEGKSDEEQEKANPKSETNLKRRYANTPQMFDKG